MQGRMTLRSHLDQSAAQIPHGGTVGAVIEAIADKARDRLAPPATATTVPTDREEVK